MKKGAKTKNTVTAALPKRQQPEKLSIIQVNDELRGLASELKEIGEKLTFLGEQKKIQIEYLAVIASGNDAAESLRVADLEIDEKRENYLNCDSAQERTRHRLGHIAVSYFSSDRYCLLWRRNYWYQIGWYYHSETLLRFSEYSMDYEDIPDLPLFAQKLIRGNDKISEYIKLRCPADAKIILEDLSQPNADSLWRGWSEGVKFERTKELMTFIEKLLISSWFDECPDGDKIYDGITDYHFPDGLQQLQAAAFTAIDCGRLNRRLLKETYSCGITAARRTPLVLLHISTYLASTFWSVVDDILNSNEEIYPVADELLDLGRCILKAFPNGKIRRIEPCPARITLCDGDLSFLGITREQADLEWSDLHQSVEREADEVYQRFQMDDVMALIRDAHKKMLQFIERIVQETKECRILELTVAGDGADVSVTAGKTPVALTNGGKRTVICLALLSHKEWFSVQEFSELYFGKKPDASLARKDFDGPIRSLKKHLPGIGFDDDHKGHRHFEGFKLNLMIAPDDLQSNLIRLRGGVPPKPSAGRA